MQSQAVSGVGPQRLTRKQDRRVFRSRRALLSAAVRLVSERSTTALSVTELAEAADVSRQLIYLHFGDRDSLLVEAALDLVRRELVPCVEECGDDQRGRALACARHYAQYRSFYRAMLTGSCAFEMTRTLSRSFTWLTAQAVRTLFGELDEDTGADLVTLLGAGSAAMVNDWLIDGGESLDPENLAERLLRLGSVLAGRQRAGARRRRQRQT